MKTFIATATIIFVGLSCLAADRRGLLDIASKMASIDRFHAKVEHEIVLPSADDPLLYEIDLDSDAAPSDSLAPVSYLIRWTLSGTNDSSNGFSAYFNGNLFQYRDQRLREFHFADERQTFAPVDDPKRGLQNNIQFVNLIPQYISRTLEEMASDPTYSYTIHPDSMILGMRRLVIDGCRSYGGEISSTFTYILDRETFMPHRIETSSSHGASGQQETTSTYSYSETNDRLITPKDEKTLSDLFPEIFADYRERDLTPSKLIRRHFPAFSLPTTTGERYTLDKTARFAKPTIIVLLDTDNLLTPELVKTLREAVDNGGDIDLIMAFTDNNIDRIEAVTGNIRQGEHLLINARGLSRDCGAGTLPVAFYCMPSAIINDISEGFNKDTADIVIKKAAKIAE